MKHTATTRRRLLSAATSIACLAGAVFAQVETTQRATQTTKGAVMKGRAPVNSEILQVKLPKAQEARLKNGLRIVLLESHRLPTFSIEMVVLSGGLSDPVSIRGLAAATATLLIGGTRRHTGFEISKQIDVIGGTLNASSDLSSVTSRVTASGLVENFDQILDVFTEVILMPTFPPDEVEKYKARAISWEVQRRGDAGFLANERFQQAIYGRHLAGSVVLPVDSIKKITSNKLARFHAEHYLPNNAILMVVGDLTLKKIFRKIDRALSHWKSSPIPLTSIPAVSSQSASKIYLVNRPNSIQTNLQVGVLGVKRTDPDYLAMVVMNQILGGMFSSRLTLNLREDKGYAYVARSTLSAANFRGTFAAISPVRTEVTEAALREILNELNRMRNEKVSATELQSAKRSIIGGFALTIENKQELLENVITQKLYNLPADYWNTYSQKIERITADDVQRVARKYVDLKHLQIVAVGEGKNIRNVLSKFGPIDEFDVDGNSIPARVKNDRKETLTPDK